MKKEIRDRLAEKKPKKVVRAEFFRDWNKKYRFGVKKSDGFACPRCNGDGRIIAPYERPDPIEGYKLADRIDCPSCKGTGDTTTEYVEMRFIEADVKYKTDMKVWEKEKKRLEEVLKRVSTADIRVLAKYL